MSTKNTQKLSQLTEEFPIIAQLRQYFKMKGDLPLRWRNPTTKVFVQKTDTDLMYLSGEYFDNTGRRYFISKKDMRGTCDERLYAVGLINSVEQIQNELCQWGQLDNKKVFKDVFEGIDSEKVEYLVFIRLVGWYSPTSEEEEMEDKYFGQKLYRELKIFIYKKPKEGWLKLMSEAERIKKEREEAYKYPPKDMPDFSAIHKALRDGGKMHAFLSVGGLRVIRIDKGQTLLGYGEHPNIEEALNYLEDDCLAGGRDYHKVYGKIHPHYLTGSCTTTSNLDAWIRRGNTFDCWQEGKNIVLKLNGYAEMKIPESILDEIKKHPRKSIQWEQRGFTFETKFTEYGYQTGVKEYPENRNRNDAFLYQITKTGRGSDFWKAFLIAIEDEEIETTK